MVSMPGTPGVAELAFLLVWLLMMAGGLIGYIILLVAIWRLMRAHESVADSLKELVQKMDQRQE